MRSRPLSGNGSVRNSPVGSTAQLSPPYRCLFQVSHEVLSPMTPRGTPRTSRRSITLDGAPSPDTNDDGVPEGFLATESGNQLSASFSTAQIRASPEERKLPSVSAMDLTSIIDTCGSSGGHHGDYACCVAVGDSLGRVDLYEMRRQRYPITTSPLSDLPSASSRLERKHTHQAFVGEFDCLTSSPVDEKVNCIRYLDSLRSPGVVSYLAANERTIKLFRARRDPPCNLSDTLLQYRREGNSPTTSSSGGASTPRTARDRSKIIMPYRAFTGPHKSPIQVLSVCADGETFLSGDDLQVYWWHLEAQDTSKASCIGDVGPDSGKIEDVSQLLTTVSFHPSHGSLFLLGRSSGHLSVGDLRDPPCRTKRRYGATFELKPDHNTIQHPEHDDILVSVSSASFIGSSTSYIVSRDYLGMKLWDVRNPSRPVNSVGVLQCLAHHLDALYDGDAIFDRFALAVDHESQTVATGCYGGVVGVWRPLDGAVSSSTSSVSSGMSTSSSTLEYYDTDSANGQPISAPPAVVAASPAPLSGGRQRSNVLSNAEITERFQGGVTEAHRDQRVLQVAVAQGGELFCCATASRFFLFRRGTGFYPQR
jgi:hypothetical protein